VQRRNQKVVEESPSCLIDPITRKAMQDQAIMLCKVSEQQEEERSSRRRRSFVYLSTHAHVIY
jgi:hypothetical protein